MKGPGSRKHLLENKPTRLDEALRNIEQGAAVMRREYAGKLTGEELERLAYFEDHVRDWFRTSAIDPTLFLTDFVRFADQVKKNHPTLRVIEGGKK